MKIKTEKGSFELKIDSTEKQFTTELYESLEERIVKGANILGIKELANIAVAVKAVKKNTGSLDDYLINIVEAI